MVLFIRITKVLFSKLRSSQHEEAQRYKKWAKSTIILMPLFGIHYAMFLWMSYYMRKQETLELIWLICDQLFASFQVDPPDLPRGIKLNLTILGILRSHAFLFHERGSTKRSQTIFKRIVFLYGQRVVLLLLL